MPLYMDVHHNLTGAKPEDVAQAHTRDLAVQEQYGVHYHTYWFNEDAGRVFCLMDAPSRDAAIAVHREAHGLLADEIIQVNGGAIDAFLQVNPALYPDPQRAEGKFDTAFRTIMFTDMEGSTAMSDRLGDAAAVEHVRQHDDIIRGRLAECGGVEVKHTGDGIMASFQSVARAVECTIAIQRALANHNDANVQIPLRVRIGMSAGEPVAEHQDLFGAAVNLAKRACDHGDAGQILVTNVVRDLCIGKTFSFIDRGDATLKGFAEPVRLFEVDWRA